MHENLAVILLMNWLAFRKKALADWLSAALAVYLVPRGALTKLPRPLPSIGLFKPTVKLLLLCWNV